MTRADWPELGCYPKPFYVVHLVPAGRVLALGGGQHLPEDGFRNLSLFDAGACNQCFEHGGAEIMRRGVGEASPETADGIFRLTALFPWLDWAFDDIKARYT